MPLIIISGRPCTGKTTFSNAFKSYLEEKGCQVDLFNEESLNITKKIGYSNSHKEKEVRGVLKSSVDHSLSPEKYVIIDSLNYIKGYRYELYCTARTIRTTHCCIWVTCSEELSNDINNKREQDGVDSYDPSM
jgi:protein KTI12